VMSGQELLELPGKKRIDPGQQDRRHARRVTRPAAQTKRGFELDPGPTAG
jgi:hypothetical protein